MALLFTVIVALLVLQLHWSLCGLTLLLVFFLAMEYYDSTITWIHALQQILLRSYSSLLSSHFHTFTLDWIIITVWVDGASNQERMART